MNFVNPPITSLIEQCRLDESSLTVHQVNIQNFPCAFVVLVLSSRWFLNDSSFEPPISRELV